jgi:hypothetical protein
MLREAVLVLHLREILVRIKEGLIQVREGLIPIIVVVAIAVVEVVEEEVHPATNHLSQYSNL